MESMDGKKKQRGARMALYSAMLAANMLNPHGTPAGKREALSKSDGPKVSDTQKPPIPMEQTPDDPPKMRFKMKEDV